MWLKPAIIIVLLLLLASLVSGMAFLIKDKGTTERTKNALGVRVTLAIILMLLISYGALTGQLRSQAPWSKAAVKVESQEQPPLNNINEDKKSDPNHVDKVPVPG